MQKITDMYAAEGFITLCPDLFWRIQPHIQLHDKKPEELQRAFELFGEFNVDTGMDDIRETIEYARAHPKCNGQVAIVGYCLGGFLAYKAAFETDCNAAVSYYGVKINEYLVQGEGIAK